MESIKHKYKKNFISKVILRLDFPPILRLNSEIPSEFQSIINKIFPVYEKKLEYISTMSIKEKEIIANEVNPIHQFKNPENGIKVIIKNNSFCVDADKYKDFNGFKEFFKPSLDAFFKIYEPQRISRIGLRFINEIVIKTGDPFNWKDFINPSLVHSITGFFEKNDIKEKLSRLMNQTILNFDDYSITMNYGIFNGDFPTKIHRKEYILDFDCYTSNVESSDPENILIKARLFNEEIAKMFELCIGNELRKEMEII